MNRVRLKFSKKMSNMRHHNMRQIKTYKTSQGPIYRSDYIA